jgi:hypothetical protein
MKRSPPAFEQLTQNFPVATLENRKTWILNFRRVFWKRTMDARKHRCGSYRKRTNKSNLFTDHRNWNLDPGKRYLRDRCIVVSLYLNREQKWFIIILNPIQEHYSDDIWWWYYFHYYYDIRFEAFTEVIAKNAVFRDVSRVALVRTYASKESTPPPSVWWESAS